MEEKIIKICSYCKSVVDKEPTVNSVIEKDEEKKWIPVEVYFKKYYKAKSSHGICKKCYKEKFPDIYAKHYE